MVSTVTYPVRLERWTRPQTETRVCPVCNGHGWVVEPVTVYYMGERRDEAAVTLTCYWCGGTGRVKREDR